jgi:hypothetical protein
MVDGLLGAGAIGAIGAIGAGAIAAGFAAR